MLTTVRHQALPQRTRRWIGVAVLALLLAQWAAWSHAYAHAPWRQLTQPEASAKTEHGWGHAAGSASCQLLDHFLAGQVPTGDVTT